MESEEVQVIQTEMSSNVDKWYTPLTRITPFSKALAMGLFILLPFVGFWLFNLATIRGTDSTLTDCQNVVEPPRIHIVFNKDILDTHVKGFILSNNLLSAKNYRLLSSEAVSTNDIVLVATFDVPISSPTVADVQKLAKIITDLIDDERIRTVVLASRGIQKHITVTNLDEQIKYLHPSDTNKYIVIVADNITELVTHISTNYSDLFYLSDESYLGDFPKNNFGYELGSDKALFLYKGNKHNYPLDIGELKKTARVAHDPLSGEVTISFLTDSMKDFELRSILSRYPVIDSASLKVETMGVVRDIEFVSPTKDAESFANHLRDDTIVRSVSVIRCRDMGLY